MSVNEAGFFNSFRCRYLRGEMRNGSGFRADGRSVVGDLGSNNPGAFGGGVIKELFPVSYIHYIAISWSTVIPPRGAGRIYWSFFDNIIIKLIMIVFGRSIIVLSCVKQSLHIGSRDIAFEIKVITVQGTNSAGRSANGCT